MDKTAKILKQVRDAINPEDVTVDDAIAFVKDLIDELRTVIDALEQDKSNHV
jgi:hypothetical protein